MSAVTIPPELLEGLDQLASNEGCARDEIVAQAVAEFLDRQNDNDAMSEWHIPLVQEGIEQADRGEFVEFDRDRILEKIRARRR